MFYFFFFSDSEFEQSELVLNKITCREGLEVILELEDLDASYSEGGGTDMKPQSIKLKEFVSFNLLHFFLLTDTSRCDSRFFLHYLG